MAYTKNKIGIGLLNNCKLKLPNTYTISNYRNDTWDKNVLLRDMINDQCEHLFLVNNQIGSVDDNIFEQYIDAASKSGLWVMFFKENQKPINAIDYNGISISFQSKLSKSFTYIHRGIIKNIGFFDERFDNAILEQDDFVYRITSKKLLPGWGMFPDLEESEKYIHSVFDSIEKIKDQIWFNEKSWFNYKHKVDIDNIDNIPNNIALQNLEKIKGLYSNDKNTDRME